MIRDYLACSQRAYYRMYEPQEAVPTEEMSIGTVVHEVISKNPKNYEDALEMAKVLIHANNFPFDYRTDRITKALNNYFSGLNTITSDKDMAEKFFDIPFSRGVSIVGKFDRITTDGYLLDFKTSWITPKTLTRDIQFNIYYWAYQKLYNKVPTKTFWVGLLKNELVEFIPVPFFMNQLFNEVIPEVAKNLNNKRFIREGMYKEECEYCSYIHLCWSSWEVGT